MALIEIIKTKTFSFHKSNFWPGIVRIQFGDGVCYFEINHRIVLLVHKGKRVPNFFSSSRFNYKIKTKWFFIGTVKKPVKLDEFIKKSEPKRRSIA